MMTKLIHKGKEYEAGKYYYFYNVRIDDGLILPLQKIKSGKLHPFIAGGRCWRRCAQVSLDDLGGITEPSIELEDVEVYRFKLKGTSNCLLGTYDKKNDWLNVDEGRVHLKADCEGFVKLVPEVK